MAPNFPQDALKDPLFIKWYRDEDGEKVSVSRLNEQQIVMGGHIYLNEIPDEFYRVQIDGYVEKQQGEVLVNNNDFIVNYTSGQLTFKSTEEAKTILVKSYMARGVVYYPASRIYTHLSSGGDIESTLSEVVDSIAAYSYKGIYAPVTIYTTNQQVEYNGSTYICVVPSSVGIPPTNTSNWRIFAAGNYFKGDYVTSVQYYPRDTVQYNNAIYQCIQQPTIGILPTNTTYWIQMFSANQVIQNAITATNSANSTNSTVITAEELRDSAETGRSNAETVRVNAEAIRLSNETNRVSAELIRETIISNTKFTDNYNGSTQYFKNNIVAYNGSSYMAKQDTKGNVPTNTTYWGQVAQRGIDGEGSVESVNGIFPDLSGNVTVFDNVDNTSDMDKPISTAQQAALDGKVDKSQVLTNVPANAIFTDTVYTHPSSHPASMITDLPTGKKVVRFVVGTSTDGWTAADCDYLCDGTNDQEEIIQAISALPATGGEIVILDGTYNIVSSISITRNNVSLKGTIGTILKSQGNFHMITLDSVENCSIEGLTLDGNNKATSTSSRLVSLADTKKCNVSKNQLQNWEAFGIYASGKSVEVGYASITDNLISNVRTGISVNRTNNLIANNRLYIGGATGIDIGLAINTLCIGNVIEDYNVGISTRNNSRGVTIEGNTIRNNECGITLTSTMNSNVVGNTIIKGDGTPGDYTEAQYSIYGSSSTTDNLISSNSCMGKAITVEGGTGNTIIDNKWSNSSGRILESYSEKLVALSGTSTAINLSLGNVFTHTLTGNTTYTISNAISGQAHSFTLIITQTETVRTITFPTSVKWQGGEIPDLSTASKTYVLTFMTIDGGETWLGMFGGEF